MVFFLDMVSCRYQLSPTGLLCHLGSLLPYCFLSGGLSIDVSEMLKVSYYYCIHFSLYVC